MLARRRKVRLSNGIELETPLLIPSLSTRNVGRLDHEEEGTPPTSYASVVLDLLGNHIDEALLVSAYDLHYRRLHDSERLLASEAGTSFEHPNLLMIDSGLYETRERVGYDDGYEQPRQWDPDMYGAVLHNLPAELDAVIVNYDLNADQLGDPEEMKYEAQLSRARRFFSQHSDLASAVLLKPEGPRGFVESANLAPVVADLAEFDIVAVTEKELGDTLRQRFTQLALLRKQLDSKGIEAPIHVFGGLDPLLTPLYVACGAEIVDGVGWLRYSYDKDDDTARYLESRPVLELDIDSRVPNRLFVTLSENLTYLRSLKRRLETLIETKDWKSFSPQRGERLKKVIEQVLSNPEVK